MDSWAWSRPQPSALFLLRQVGWLDGSECASRAGIEAEIEQVRCAYNDLLVERRWDAVEEIWARDYANHRAEQARHNY